MPGHVKCNDQQDLMSLGKNATPEIFITPLGIVKYLIKSKSQ